MGVVLGRPGLETWGRKPRDILKETPPSGQQGQYCKGNTNVDLTQIQAASNHTHPLPYHGSGGNNTIMQEANHTASGTQQGGILKPSEARAQTSLSLKGEQAEIVETSLATYPKTIFFDLNAMRDVEAEEQGYAQEMCDLSLNLTVPAPTEQHHSNIPPATFQPRPRIEEVLASKGTDQTVGEGSNIMQSNASCPAALMMGELCNPTGGTQVELVKGAFQATTSHSARLMKRRGRWIWIEVQRRGAK